jgi:hypothetical protein
MSADQILVWFAHAFDGPFTVLLILLAGLAGMLWTAQHRGKLDLAQMFKDDSGKESGLRFAILGAWIMSSWTMMALVVAKSDQIVMVFSAYLLFWSGAPIASKLIDKWNGTLPWAKP